MRRALLIASLLALSACEAKPIEGKGDELTRLISERVGRQVELHYVETEPGGTKATCGLAGNRPTASRSKVAPPPPNEALFIYEGGKLTVSDGVIIPAELEATVRRSCPSMTTITLPPVP